MPRRKAPPRRNEGVGVEAASTPPARKKSRSGTRHPPLAEPVEVAIRERQPEDVVLASLEGVAVGAPETDDVPLGSAGARALVRPASRDHASFEWARMCRPATISTETRAEMNDDDDDALRVEAPPRAGWRRYAFPAETLAIGHADTTGETLLECFLALLREGALGLVRAASGLGDEHPEEKQKKTTSDAEKNRLRVCLTADAFADAPAFAEHASRKKKHARLRRVLAHWLCPPTDAVERFAAGVATSAGETSARGIPGGIPRDAKTHEARTETENRNVSRDAAARAAYAAAKPPREAPAFAGAFPGLLPDPRPYQRRAVHWMVRREKGGADAASKAPGTISAFVTNETKRNASLHPLWSPLRNSRVLAEERSAGASCFVNWHTGQVSRVAFPAPPDVKGGILADEMGLGKTVELLMCVLAHRYEGPEPRDDDADAERKPNELDESHEIVGCVCGVDGVDYDGLWLCCESCLEWSHARCVGYTAADEKKHAARVAEAAEAEARAEAAEAEARAFLARENQRAAHTTEPPSDDETRRGDSTKAERGEAAVRLATSPDPLATNEEEDADAEKDAEKEEEDSSSVLLDALRAAERATRLTRLARERAEDAPFTCGRCVARRAGCHVSGPCGATLVVCPSAILAQWRSELKRHAAPGALNVMTYEGQPRGASGPDAKTRAMKNTRNAPVSALDLARADVVLTTYETLRGDLHHAPDAAASDGDGLGGTGGRASRHRKKYEIIPTPLTRLTWWRVVLDEAQEVESSTAAAAAMACLVPGVHRWAVTGTPVSRGVEDLQGLFAFLRAPSPLTDRAWFRRVVEAPFEKGHAPSVQRALLDVLRRVMWRNTRADVADELRLPPQGQTLTSLRPSGIEAHWYRKQREVCERAAREALRRVVDPARARAEAAADRERNREGGPTSLRPRRDAAAFAPGAGRRLGGRPDDDRDGGTGDAFAIDDLIDDDEDDAVSSGGDSPRRDGVEDDAVAVDLTANDDAANAVDRRLTAEESRRVLVPLLRLRQACNHPQAGTHGVRGLIKGGAARADGILAGAHIGAGGIHSGAIMSMPQIHAVLIEKQRVEAEEAQRLVAFTRNASAGVACCEARFGAAVEHYRQVLKLEASGAADGLGLRLDPLQRLHALHNLRLALDAADEAAAKKTSEEVAVSRALRDDTLIRDAETERQKYLASRAGGVGAASEHMRRTSAAVASALARCGAAARGPGPAGATWWAEALSLARRDARDEGSGLFDRLVDGALQGSWQGERVAFTDLNGFRFALERDLEKLTTLRATFLEDAARLEKITADAKPEDVDAAGRCGACVLGGGEKRNFFFDSQAADSRRHDAAFTSGARGREAPVTCHHCLAQPRLAAYEDAVFGRQASDEHVRGGARGRVARADVGAGRSAPSSAETALRFLLAKCVSRSVSRSLFEAGSAHVESLELMRREFRNACVLQMHQRDELHARDELAMATTRIRTRRDDEIALGGLPDPVPERLRASVVHAWELPEMEAQYAADRAAHEADLRRAASQVRFLERLRREDEQARVLAATASASANGKPENVSRTSNATFECPVCQEDADGSTAAAELAVLPCGHKLCVSCTDALVSRAPPPPNSRHPKSFKCPTCRERTPADEINYVSSGGARASVERFFFVKAPSDDADDAGDAPDAPDAPRWDMDASLGTEQEQLAFEASVVVKGSWGTKIEAVTRRVLWVLDANRNGADPATKIIVFSEWEDALRVTAAALRANGVAVAHPGGGGKKLRDAVEAFAAKRDENENENASGSAADPDARVLLMPLRRGANGLNLTSAQHVILLEPVMDPGAEAQAMKRVDRIGQTKPTFVHRFTLLNTVEENVQALSRRRRECAPGDDDAGGARGAGLRVSEARLLVEGTSATKTERA